MRLLSDRLRDSAQVEDDQMRYSSLAFPVAEQRDQQGHTKIYADPGMNMHDYFAAHAMQGLLAQAGWVAGRLINGLTLSQQAYQIAEEMVQERQRG